MRTLPFNHPEFHWDFLQVKSGMGVTSWDGCVIHDAFGMSPLQTWQDVFEKGKVSQPTFQLCKQLGLR